MPVLDNTLAIAGDQSFEGRVSLGSPPEGGHWILTDAADLLDNLVWISAQIRSFES